MEENTLKFLVLSPTEEGHTISSSEDSEEMIRELVEAITLDTKQPRLKIHIEEFAFDILGENIDVCRETTVKIISKEQILASKGADFSYCGELWEAGQHLSNFNLFLSIWNTGYAVTNSLNSKKIPFAFSLDFPRYPVQIMDTLIRFTCMEKITAIGREHDTSSRGLLMFWPEKSSCCTQFSAQDL